MWRYIAARDFFAQISDNHSRQEKGLWMVLSRVVKPFVKDPKDLDCVDDDCEICGHVSSSNIPLF